jgi:hypothetical protein
LGGGLAFDEAGHLGKPLDHPEVGLSPSASQASKQKLELDQPPRRLSEAVSWAFAYTDR